MLATGELTTAKMGGNKAFEVSEFAGGDWKKHAAIVDRPVREPKAGEVLVEVYLRPVNPTGMPKDDLSFRCDCLKALRGSRAGGRPALLGRDISGWLKLRQPCFAVQEHVKRF